jgi:hypothetical protein
VNINDFKLKYPWPDAIPEVKVDGHGWFGWCHQEVLDHLLGSDVKLILELGSWLGKSTRWFCRKCPQATIITVDHWLGTPEISADDEEAGKKVSTLYETFLINCWKYKNQIIPIRKTTSEAISELATNGIIPDLIYIDASHNYEDVKLDLCMCHSNFPKAQLCGDDYGGKWQGVKKAVDQTSEITNRKIYSVEHAWAIVPAEFIIPECKRTFNDEDPDDIGDPVCL